MQITVEIAPALGARLAAQAQAQGVALERYISQTLEQTLKQTQAGADVPLAASAAALPLLAPTPSREQVQASLDALARYSAEIPSLPDEAFTRQSFYDDHD